MALESIAAQQEAHVTRGKCGRSSSGTQKQISYFFPRAQQNNWYHGDPEASRIISTTTRSRFVQYNSQGRQASKRRNSNPLVLIRDFSTAALRWKNQSKQLTRFSVGHRRRDARDATPNTLPAADASSCYTEDELRSAFRPASAGKPGLRGRSKHGSPCGFGRSTAARVPFSPPVFLHCLEDSGWR